MPMKWQRGKKSPYACNHFAVLHVGPNTDRKEISQTSGNTLRELQTAQKVYCACGHEVDVHQVGDATSKLLDADSLAEELLLIHPQPPRDNQAKVKVLTENLKKAASLSNPRQPIPLRHPAALFWFMPCPADDAIELPEWRDFGLVSAGDADDMALDIVFDC